MRDIRMKQATLCISSFILADQDSGSPSFVASMEKGLSPRTIDCNARKAEHPLPAPLFNVVRVLAPALLVG